MPPQPERTTIAAGLLEIPRMISGLWQLAGGHDESVDIDVAARCMRPLVEAGLDCFDMADHYGDAELVVGRYHDSSDSRRQPITAFTKWCPAETGVKTFDHAQEAVDRALSRMGARGGGEIALLQYHIWDYSDDTYWHNLSHLRALQAQGRIRHLGLTNTDTAHLELLVNSGFPIATNQVSCSVIDRRLTRGRMGEVCLRHGVGVLAYGTLLGGFLSEKWLGAPEPPADGQGLNWSLRKYLRFIEQAGGWRVFQEVLEALATVAKRHGVSVAAVATRVVLDLPPVSAVIVGTRLAPGSDEYIARNLEAFSVSLTDEDRALIATAQESLTDISGDCGDEYRRAPIMTVTGDLSHHLDEAKSDKLEEALAAGMRIEYSSGNKWEAIAGYCRAVRTGDLIRVSGTTANSPIASIPVLGGNSAGSQTVAVLDIIERALKRLGGTMSDVVRTRIIIRNEEDCEAVSAAHGWAFRCAKVRPANTLVVSGLIGAEYLVEIEAEAQVGSTGTMFVA
ncbi:NADP-dependent oxidoreductase domain-containing protein [Microdochium bolleyi]|uniref:NADP-dependent oxidoreductase domain-containing protein n=1 Tax=Microdochium bolleyi TaxID=196109 RepID=A0A136IMU5_9PEZI|nr:NADP-dependent oxidoreductase domain-containing protein [Microdochium bolleyi]